MMRVAILGVGLIGGSIGMAARERLGASVVAWDPEPSCQEAAARLGAADQTAATLADACAGAELIWCCAPVGALPALCAEALDAADTGSVVTDVGSTKRAVVETCGADPRLIGGHPIAGAETAGVAHARADLFEGARWYLTPTAQTRGTGYDRLQRAISGLGARPQAIDAGAHDRILAAVSHLPHVLANALVGQAAATLTEQHERMPDVGPSFRDTTRVAGANPPMWRDIFLANREAVRREIDGLIVRLTEASSLLEDANPEGLDAWIEAARADRRRLLEREMTGDEVIELRVTVPDRPGVVAEIALELGNAAVNIEDMALYPTTGRPAGAIALWVAGEDEAARAERLVAALGHQVSRAGGST